MNRQSLYATTRYGIINLGSAIYQLTDMTDAFDLIPRHFYSLKLLAIPTYLFISTSPFALKLDTYHYTWILSNTVIANVIATRIMHSFRNNCPLRPIPLYWIMQPVCRKEATR